MIKNPIDIEKRSFEIIEQEADLTAFDEQARRIITRVIHTTADFEYAGITKFHNSAIERGLKALRAGTRIYTDTRMIYGGINKPRLEETGCYVLTYIDDPLVMKQAKQKGVTRSMLGMEKAAADERIGIFIIGNAPTALFQLVEYIKTGKVSPSLIIGVPVGFVGAAESKAALMECDAPWIVTQGRKGGSPVAVAILHGLLYQL